MSRRITLGCVATLALLLTACEINVDYDLLLRADGSGEMQVEVVYDEAAAEMLGPPEGFLADVEQDTAAQYAGVTVLDSSSDSSDPDAQRVTMVLGAEDPAALDALIDDSFFGSFTHQDGDVYELVLHAEDASMDGEFGMDIDFMNGSMVVHHDGDRRSMSGGEAVDDQAVNWDPFGPSDLRMVVDLGAGGTAAAAVGAVPWVLLGLLALVVIGVVVVLLVRRVGGREASPAVPPLTGPSAGEVDAMQTPPAGDQAQWGAQAGHWAPQQPAPGSWDQPARLADPAPQASPTPQGGPPPGPVPQPGPEPDPVPEPWPEPDPVPEPWPEPDPVPQPWPEPDPVPQPGPEPDPVPDPGPSPEPQPDPMPRPDPMPEPDPSPDPMPQPEPTAEPGQRPTQDPWPPPRASPEQPEDGAGRRGPPPPGA